MANARTASGDGTSTWGLAGTDSKLEQIRWTELLMVDVCVFLGQVVSGCDLSYRKLDRPIVL